VVSVAGEFHFIRARRPRFHMFRGAVRATIYPAWSALATWEPITRRDSLSMPGEKTCCSGPGGRVSQEALAASCRMYANAGRRREKKAKANTTYEAHQKTGMMPIGFCGWLTGRNESRRPMEGREKISPRHHYPRGKEETAGKWRRVNYSGKTNRMR